MGRKRAVKPRWRNKATPETERIVEVLKVAFPNHPADYPPAAYRYNSASIRVRVVDESFRGKSRVDRDERVARLLERQLPQKTFSDIMILLLLTPEEVDEDLMNVEFENPPPSRV